ncbi:MAG: LacI family DNA-binding transcriptional regulator [Vicinamibacterales bacterium]
MANIYDVAKRARVSAATVSAVLNDSAFVSPALRARVLAAIKALAYRPNLLARGLAQQRSQTLGMIVPDIANPFFPEVVRGAEDVAREAGYSLVLASTDNDPIREDRYLQLFLAKRVDGVLLTKAPAPFHGRTAAMLRRARVPIVQVARTVPGLKADAVLMDDRGAAYEATAHLARLGYTRIAMVSGLTGASTSKQRLTGFRAALAAHGLAADPQLVAEGDYQVQSGYRAGLALLKRKPEAVFISNYLMTVGFMIALRQYRLRCPDDVAIVTCDDHPWLDYFAPRLTTMDLPKQKLGAEAAALLIDRLARPSRPSETIVLPGTLCVRESCGALLRQPAFP